MYIGLHVFRLVVTFSGLCNKCINTDTDSNLFTKTEFRFALVFIYFLILESLKLCHEYVSKASFNSNVYIHNQRLYICNCYSLIASTVSGRMHAGQKLTFVDIFKDVCP